MANKIELFMNNFSKIGVVQVGLAGLDRDIQERAETMISICRERVAAFA